MQFQENIKSYNYDIENQSEVKRIIKILNEIDSLFFINSYIQDNEEI